MNVVLLLHLGRSRPAYQSVVTNEIGPPRPQLEPQITCEDTCNINFILYQKHQFSKSLGLGSGVPIPSMKSITCAVLVTDSLRKAYTITMPL